MPTHQRRCLSSRSSGSQKEKATTNQQQSTTSQPQLTHISESGAARMVSIDDKDVIFRIATAVCRVRFSDETAPSLIRADQMKKGDVLGVARIAGIMAAKRTPDLIPLCHPVPVSRVSVDLALKQERSLDASETVVVDISATVECRGRTGVEMEALTAASTAALTVYDMCKAVDRSMVIEGLHVVLKDGGRSGRWEMGKEVPTE